MLLFILESIGTSELILVGIVALIFLGPRKLPEMARKMGKMMNEFRSTTNEFKETWQREVNFEEEKKSLNLHDIDAETVTSDAPTPPGSIAGTLNAPAIKQVDAAEFEHLAAGRKSSEKSIEQSETSETNDKMNWL